ncbi:ParB/RepB/Spo0J family partition protein [Marinicella sp. W31]|uniref:ParB/RepB/Spo0J family partition protein n=1 Tax=Marinicella sp. W31 TaxID=3023713 RepID=UPI0037582F25
MMSKKSSLGRGLDALLASRSNAGTAKAEVERSTLPIEQLQPGEYQPRSHMDKEKLQELSDSIRSQGIVQPIIVRKLEKGRYEIIAGERRWRAAQLAQLSEVPVVIKDVSDQQTIAMALIENIQREDLNPLEEAMALQRLIDEFSLTHQQAAEAVGRSRVAVSNLLRLLDVHEQVKDKLLQGLLEMGHARALLAVASEDQPKLAEMIVNKKMTVRQTEAMVKKHNQTEVPEIKPQKNSDIKHLEVSLTEKLCTKVELMHSPAGKGKLVVHYHDSDQLQGILDRIK